jgi:ATP-binding cassette subfamily F protein 3
MLRLQNLKKSYLGKIILKDESYLFPQGKQIAIVGANGAGKTTLLNIISGVEKSDAGQVITSKGYVVGYLPQTLTHNPDNNIVEECISGAGMVFEIKRNLDKALAELEANYSEEVYERYTDLEDQFKREGGYVLESKAKKLLAGLGFRNEQFDLSPVTLSGGWKMRLELAKLLLKEPDFLILDEPTNHLDLPSIIWLEGYFKRFRGTMLFVSHDRDLLNRLAQVTLHLNRGVLTPYTGNFDSFLEQYEARQAINTQQLKTMQKRSAQVERFVERFRATASKATQVKSRLKMLDRLKSLENNVNIDQDEAEISMQIKIAQPSGRNVLDLKDCAIGYDKILSSKINLNILKGQKIAIVGSNGIGKSTLLKSITSHLNFIEGSCKLGYNVNLAYYAQDQLDYLRPEISVLENVMTINPSLNHGSARALLGRFLLTGQEAFKPVKVLSGGEKSRVGLVCLLAKEANFLILDEPTNHLDMSSTEVLASALVNYEGTVLFVSHNRSFIEEVATHIFVMTQDGKSMLFEGNLESYKSMAEKSNFPNIFAMDE